jgi:PAS domain S-box-containing protein
VAIDVTHRVLMERALRDSGQQFTSVFEHAPVGMAIIGSSSELQHANEALARMLGLSAQELEGRNVIEMRHPDSPPEADERYEDLLAGRIAQYHQEHAFRHRDGSPVWVRVSVVPLSGAGTAPGTLIAIVEDRSRLKRMEVQLRQAHRLEAVGMLAAGIAHEIDMPIQAVRDNLTFLSDTCAMLIEALSGAQRLSSPVDQDASGRLERLLSPLDLPSLREEVPSAARQSLEGVARITSIVSAMQGFGRPDPSEPTPIDINAAVRDTTTVARNEYKYVADLELDLGDVPPVPGYPSLFHQALLNLVVNAAHAIDDAVAGTERRGSIRIATTADADHVHVAVSDDGVGMPAEVQEHIFEPYFTTKDLGRGTGQGLAVVRGVIVQQHNGAIRVESTPGEGTTFILTLPLRGATGATGTSSAGTGATGTSSAGGLGRTGTEVPGRPPSGHPLDAL